MDIVGLSSRNMFRRYVHYNVIYAYNEDQRRSENVIRAGVLMTTGV